MNNSLKKIISDGIKGLSNIFRSDNNSESSLGIDIGSSAIKVVQLRKKNGKAVLETYGALSLGPYAKTDIGSVTNLQADDISRALLDVIKESKVTITSGVIAIPSSSSLIFTISLPGKVNEDRLASIVPIEARKYIPIPISEVTLDWSVIPQEPKSLADSSKNFLSEKKTKSDLEVLVVAIHNETLSRYQEILKKTKIQSESFEMEIFANIRSSISHDLAPILMIDFGASKTKLSIVEAGVVRVFHVVNRGSSDISKNISQSLGIPFIEAEKLKRSIGLISESNNKEAKDIIQLSIDYIFSDIKSVVFAYEKKYNKTISKVVLTGGGSLLKGLLEQAQESLHTEVIRTDPFSKTEAPAFLKQVLEESGPEFSVAVGLALRQL